MQQINNVTGAQASPPPRHKLYTDACYAANPDISRM